MCASDGEVVFGSPRRLNLRLVCTTKTPAKDTLDVWPAFPLIIQAHLNQKSVDNVIVVLERRDRVHEIDFHDVDHSPLEKVLGAMQEPFPQLTELRFELGSVCDLVPARSWGDLSLVCDPSG